jgi:hypothetical protein
MPQRSHHRRIAWSLLDVAPLKGVLLPFPNTEHPAAVAQVSGGVSGRNGSNRYARL